MTKKVAIRSMIVAPKGYTLIACDLSAAEAWVVAYLANDPNMKKGLATNTFHENTARIIFDLPEDAPIGKDSTERYLGKRNNHANNYGQGPFQLVTSINADSDKPPYVTITHNQGKLYHSRWHSYYSVKNWWANVQDKLNRDRTLTTVYGRRRKFFGFWGDGLFKEAYAFEPQSTIADHMLGAVQPLIGVDGGVREIYKRIVKLSGGEIRITNTAHDSVILEAPKSVAGEIARQVVDCLYRPMIIEGEELYVPVDCEMGGRWTEGMDKVKIDLSPMKKSY